MQYPIIDQPEGRRLYLLCWPDSTQWRIVLRGLMTAPTRGRYWDAKTGNVKSMQTFAEGAINLMDCQEFIDVLNGIKAAIEGIEGTQIDIVTQATASAQSQAASANAQAELNSVMIQAAQAQAIASSWSLSMAEATASVIVKNNVSVTLVPYDPMDVPPAAAITEAGFDDVPPIGDLELCGRIVYIVDSLIYMVSYLKDASQTVRNLSQNAALGLVEGILNAVYYKFFQVAPPAGASKIASMTSIIGLLSLLNPLFDSQMETALQFLVDERSTMICALWNGVHNDYSTAALRNELAVVLAGLPGLFLSLAMTYLDLSLLGILYLTPTGQDWSTITSIECDGLCGV